MISSYLPTITPCQRSWIAAYTDIGQVALPVISGGYALFKKDYKGFGWLALSTLITQICLEILKRIVPEKRPTGSSRSFPSGNTAAAFLGPAFLVIRYGHSILSPAVAFSYLATIGVAIGRVLIKVHWPHDVLAGAALASTISYLTIPRL
ncbi:phosphatase PAP2 family protein, partial [Neochlamydia sp. TUME1]|uniref:phosphatase PAP2 family protein n=1 Tax=Neochlamydia sp. TUME1 TaxID=1478174 RepID=UPI00057F0F31